MYSCHKEGFNQVVKVSSYVGLEKLVEHPLVPNGVESFRKIYISSIGFFIMVVNIVVVVVVVAAAAAAAAVVVVVLVVVVVAVVVV